MTLKGTLPLALILSALAAACAEAETPVYVGESGVRYHRYDCWTLSGVKREMTVEAAVLAGRTPCAICNPPAASGLEDGAEPSALAETDETEEAETAEDGIAAEGMPPYRVNVAGVDSAFHADITKMTAATVTRHVDGDTVHVRVANPVPPFKAVEKIRMIGVDTPETVHPNRQVEHFGAEASAFTKDALLGKPVYLALDWDTRDRYGRLLAYIYTADGACHNAEIIRQGYGHAYTRFAFQFLDEFRRFEDEARTEGRGLWAD
jgi:micrococcal nuclease